VRGPRRPKSDLRIDCIGTVDEANASIGLARLSTASMPKLDRMLGRIQNDLFDLGSDLATPGEDVPGDDPSLRVTAKQVSWLEEQIDRYNDGLKPLTSFVLPGGTPLAVALHMGRTVVRRAERKCVALKQNEAQVSAEVLMYLNRLSDLLFVMARVANANGETDVMWMPGLYASE
jgi:cob(I)alamin adenosyltransferase